MTDMHVPNAKDAGTAMSPEERAEPALIREQVVKPVPGADSPLAATCSWPVRLIVRCLDFFYSSPNPQTSTYFDRDPIADDKVSPRRSPHLFDDTNPLSIGR